MKLKLKCILRLRHPGALVLLIISTVRISSHIAAVFQIFIPTTPTFNRDRLIHVRAFKFLVSMIHNCGVLASRN